MILLSLEGMGGFCSAIIFHVQGCGVIEKVRGFKIKQLVETVIQWQSQKFCD